MSDGALVSNPEISVPAGVQVHHVAV